MLAVASSSLCLSSGMQELSLLPFYTSPDNVPEKLFSWLSAPFSGDLPMPEGSKNQLVIIDDDRPNRHQIIMLLPVNKEELVSTFILDSDTDTDVIPLPCDQDACIAWDYKGHVNVLDLSETVVESGRFKTKAKRIWEVIRTMGQNGDIIYQWYDQDGYLHTLSEWEFQRRLSVYFQSLLEYLYPEFFDSTLPAGGGWHRWQYKNVRQASDHPEKNDPSPWQVQGQRRKKGAKPVAAVRPVPVKHTGSQPDWQQCRRYRWNEASTSSSSADKKEAIDTLIKEFETGALQRRANWFGERYDGINHSRFCNKIKMLTQARKAPLYNEEKHRFEPFMKHLSKVVYSFNGKSLSICVHSLTVSELLDPHSHHSVRMSQQHLSEELLDAIKSQARRPREQANMGAQGVSNNLWSLAKLVARKALTPKQASPAVTALLLQVKNYQADFIPQHVANQLWALAKLVEREVFTPDQASPAVTALLLQVQHHQADFIPQHVANQQWALAKLVAHEVLTPEQAGPAVTTLLQQVQYHQANFNPQQIVNQLWALAKLVEHEVFTPEQASPAVTALLQQVQDYQAKFSPQGVANLLWALAKLVEHEAFTPEQASPVVTALLQQVQDYQAKFTPQGIANQLWALAKLVEHEVLTPEQASPAVTALLQQVQDYQAMFNPQQIANQLWALAKLVEHEAFTPEQASPVVTALLQQVPDYQAKFTPQGIANQLWALAKLVEHKVSMPEQGNPAVMALLAEVQEHQAKFLPQGIANQLWALAKLMERGILLLEQDNPAVTALLQQVQEHQAKFNPQQIANQLWALAKLVESGVLMLEQTSPAVTALLQQVQDYQAKFSPQDIANQLWALAKLMGCGFLMLEQASPALMALLQQVQKHQAKFSSQEITNQLWALAVFGDWIKLDTISNILGMLNIDAFKSSQSQEIALWTLTVFLAKGLDQPAVKSSMMKLYKTLKDEEKKVSSESRGSILRLSGVWLEENLQDLPMPNYKSVISKSQTTQYEILTKKFPNRTLETEASVDGLPPVDILFSREKVAIEIQGPYHYLDREKQIRTGRTILKITTYQKLGYKVIEVHASDVSKRKRQKELYRKLLTHFSKTDDDSVHNSCDLSDWDRDEEDDERFSAED